MVDVNRRERKALETRRRIRTAARDLFVEQGYSATTIQQVAARADVAWQTVYSVFGTKAAILSEVFDVAVAGDDEPVEVARRPFVAAMQAADTRAEKARIFAEHLREAHASTAPVLSVIEAAAGGDEEMAALWAKLQGQRLHGMTMAAADLAASGAVRADRTEGEAADVLWLLTGPWAYRALVTERGWTHEAYEGWLADALQALVLGRD